MTQTLSITDVDSNTSASNELVNSPAHYTQGRCGEAIDVIEDVIKDAPDPITGMLLGNTLKYLLRVWHKYPDNPNQDLGKAQWYLNRVISHLQNQQNKEECPALFRERHPLPTFDDPLQ